MNKAIYASLLSIMIFSIIAGAQTQDSGAQMLRPGTTSPKESKYLHAVDLYRSGLYTRARAIFESEIGDPMFDGYVVLCALAEQSEDRTTLLYAFERNHPKSVLSDRIRFEYARELFDAERYAEASIELSKVSSSILTEKETPEFVFKSGFCAFTLGQYPEAQQFFTILEALEFSEYSAPARYLSGVILYYNNDFVQAKRYFDLARTDPRFTEICEFYIVDCEFNQKNYKFAVEEGERIYPTSPDARKLRLARIISESSLILGDNDKARQYLDGLEGYKMTRKDYFFAGSVLYSVHDYQGAIENYTRMGELRDSLGQIAAYHLANSRLRTRNQVAAMEAFHLASQLDYDPKIKEDASFNYAKLAFDLNKDSSGFTEYIRRYSTRTRGVQIYGYMALAALIDRDYQAAVDAYDNIDELDGSMQSNYTKANFLRAQQLFASGSYRDAIPYFRVCSYYLPKTSKLNQYARYWMAEANYRTGEYAEAERLFAELYNGSALFDKREGDLLSYNTGYSLFKQGDYEAAARWFDNYIGSGHKAQRQDAMSRRADCDFGRRDYKSAVASYQRVMNEFPSPDNIYPYYRQALAYGLMDKKKDKLNTLLKVKSASPGAPLYQEAWYELGRAQMDNKQNSEAIKSFQHLKDNSKDNYWIAKALSGLGMVYRNSSDYNRSLESYKQIVSLMQGSEYAEEALLAIESVYQKLKQPHKYLEYLEQNSLSANKTEAEREKMYFNTGEQLFMGASYAEAINSLSKFVETFPQSNDVDHARFYLAESYRAMGDKEKACTYFAMSKNSSSDLSYVEMSKLRYAQLSYDLERFKDAYDGYSDLHSSTKIETNIATSRLGMMRSAYKARIYEAAVSASELVISADVTPELRRECLYIKAKSSMALSRRDEALGLFRTLANEPATAEGAEAKVIIIQDSFDTGRFDAVENAVYEFSKAAGEQSYWLAKAFLLLGDSFTERGQYEQAKATYASVRDGYAPDDGQQDDIADNVRKRMDRLETLMTK